MKLIVSSVLVCSLLALAAPAADDLKSNLQRGLFEEEANRNLPAAITAYQAVAAQFDKDRELAATAVFRLGECYRKLDKTNDAVACYQRILREFADQPTLATLSRQNLAALGTAPPVAATAASTDEEEKEIRRLQALVQNSPDLLNTVREPSGAPLHEAASRGQLRVAQFLLDHGADVDIKSGAGRTPLDFAARQGNKAMVELLLNRKADINSKQTDRRTALHTAVEFGYKAVAELLLSRGAEVNARGFDGTTPLHLAALDGHDAVVELLLSRKAEVDAKNDRGTTPLISAACKEQIKTARLLLAAGADVNAKYDGRPVVQLALNYGSEMLALLLAHKPDLESTDAYGFTAVQRLVMSQGEKRPEMLQMLLQAGGNPDKPFAVANNTPQENRYVSFSTQASLFDINRNTPLVVACRMIGGDFPIFRGSIPMIEALLAGGANVNAKSTDGKTPLLYAVEAGSLPMVEAILARKPDLEARDPQDVASLIKAIGNTQAGIAEKLVQAGAKVNVVSPRNYCNGGSPLHLAAQRGRDDLIELLLTNKAKVNILDQNAETPLDWANRLASQTANPGVAPRANYEAVIALLLRHGADETFTRRTRIVVARKAGNFSSRVFTKGTNDWNRYTLLELIATVYADPNSETGKSLRFPDLSAVTIQRLDANGGAGRDIPVNVAALLTTGDCAQDPWLEWGDIVNIPEQDHPVNESWQGLAEALRNALTKCLQREVQIVIKGESRKVALKLSFQTSNYGMPPGFPMFPPGVALGAPVPGSPTETQPIGLSVFRLNEVLKQSNLLRVSSDLTHIHVKRSDPLTQKPVEWTVNLAPAQPYDAPTDLWLRNGDVIEVPEKP